MHTDFAVIRSASLHGYSELAASVGLQPQRMLRQAGLDPRVLEQPEALLRVSAVRALLESSAAQSGAEDFGLRLAQGRRLSNFGPIAIVLQEAPTGRAALESLVRYLRLLNASLLTRIEDHGNLVLIREEFVWAGGQPMRQSMELAIGVMHGVLQELLGPKWRARSVCLMHRAPRDAATHRAMFGAGLEFNASFNGIVCAAADLQRPLTPRVSGLGGYARQFLEQALSRTQADTSDTVRQLIVALLPGGRCTADQVAQHLGVDRRTLHRHLQAEGHSFSSLLQIVRSEFAARQIRDSDRTLAELADLLGFSSASAFAHWFKQSQGCTVSAWRARQT